MVRGRSAIGLINLFACPAISRQNALSALAFSDPCSRGTGLGTFQGYNYMYSNKKGRVRTNAA